ncbi:MAG: flagellar basal body L-ring protein FlgH [Roseovarius sp.]
MSPSGRLCIVLFVLLAGCGRMDHLGKPPSLSDADSSDEHAAMLYPGLPLSAEPDRRVDRASLWSGGQNSLLGDHRAMQRGDILTVVIEIDDQATISNSTSRSRNGSETLSIPQLFGLPQRVDQHLPEGASLSEAVSLSSTGTAGGDGSVRRQEKLTLRIAATVINVLPSGVLEIAGTQEVRVNYELRELLVQGFVRPADISRRNEVTYDKIAAARISYGGRGQISDVQQPRYGQQLLDMILPF